MEAKTVVTDIGGSETCTKSIGSFGTVRMADRGIRSPSGIMTDEEFDADALGRLRRGIEGMEDRVQIIDTGRPGRIGAPRHRLLPVDAAGSAEKLSR